MIQPALNAIQINAAAVMDLFSENVVLVTTEKPLHIVVLIYVENVIHCNIVLSVKKRLIIINQYVLVIFLMEV